MSDQERADAVIRRLSEHLGTKTDAELAERFGLTRSAVKGWRARGTIPFQECLKVAERDHLSLDWLITGRGPKRMTEIEMQQSDENPKPVTLADYRQLKRRFYNFDFVFTPRLITVGAVKDWTPEKFCREVVRVLVKDLTDNPLNQKFATALAPHLPSDAEIDRLTVAEASILFHELNARTQCLYQARFGDQDYYGYGVIYLSNWVKLRRSVETAQFFGSLPDPFGVVLIDQNGRVIDGDVDDPITVAEITPTVAQMRLVEVDNQNEEVARVEITLTNEQLRLLEEVREQNDWRKRGRKEGE